MIGKTIFLANNPEMLNVNLIYKKIEGEISHSLYGNSFTVSLTSGWAGLVGRRNRDPVFLLQGSTVSSRFHASVHTESSFFFI